MENMDLGTLIVAGIGAMASFLVQIDWTQANELECLASGTGIGRMAPSWGVVATQSS